MEEKSKDIIQPRAVSGFPEFLPEDQLEFQRLLEIVKTGFETFGFTPIETPAAERLDILASKGEIQKQIYGLYRPNVPEQERETDLALHFDLTVPLARYVAMNFSRLTFPFRRYQIQRVWRGERPQKGRFREFYQCDIDAIGSETLDPLNDAEIPAVIRDIFEKMQIGEFMIRISNRKIFQGFLLNNNFSKETIPDILRSVDRLPKLGEDAVKRELREDLDISPEIVEGILSLAGIKGTGPELLDRLSRIPVDHPVFREGTSELALLADNLTSLGVSESQWEIDLSITRGLDYYTGTVYETFMTDYPELGSVCSGGRYDNLASHFTNRRLPGVGISIGLTRLFSYLLEAKVVKSSSSCPTRVLVAVLDRERLSDYLAAATSLRNNDIPVEVYLEPRRLKAQFKYADKKGIPLVLIAGETEFKEGVWQLKHMETGDQASIPGNALVESIRKKLKS